MAETKKKSVFETLSVIDCSEHVESRNGLTYLSWAWAWQIIKQNYPTAFYTIYEREDGVPYYTDGKTAWVKTGVTIESLEHIEYLPIMDYRHKSIALENVTSFDMNTAIQRSLTKACARHGLGLYIYAGEDLPEKVVDAPKETKPVETTPGYKPLERDIYFKCVAAYAQGKMSKSGEDYLTAFVKMTGAGNKEILQFKTDVANYCYTNKMQMPNYKNNSINK